ncbi:transcriptional repressor NrdR [Arenicella chitinivorans]|uniref:Transcriptional repressor NrdR n=1 Tax=Arenicella chitinivorans TaxID=1329800 RepID=A0A918RWI8_9GAMM|nr:transcriptional repressor NrdR [Arenicella chitinivorans]
MRCPFCQNEDTRVIDSRLTEDRDAVRRRRSCEACGERFSTMEEASLKLPYIVKSNGDREHYDESKLARGLERALEKRPVESREIELILHRIKRNLLTSGEREIPAREIGELVMNELREVDQVAYVRFASVYRSFQDVDAFSDEIRRLQRQTVRGRRESRAKLQEKDRDDTHKS